MGERPKQYVIEIRDGDRLRGYADNRPGEVVDNPAYARKFDTAADAHCWLESHFLEGSAFDRGDFLTASVVPFEPEAGPVPAGNGHKRG